MIGVVLGCVTMLAAIATGTAVWALRRLASTRDMEIEMRVAQAERDTAHGQLADARDRAAEYLASAQQWMAYAESLERRAPRAPEPASHPISPSPTSGPAWQSTSLPTPLTPDPRGGRHGLRAVGERTSAYPAVVIRSAAATEDASA